MSDDFAPPTKRPGGLTALATLNIIFALIGMLGGWAMHAMNQDHDDFDRQADIMESQADEIATNASNGGDPELNRAMVRGMAAQMRQSSPQAFRLMFAAGMTGGVLLLIAGFGLLGQRRIAGRHVSTAACLALIVCGGVAVYKLPFLFWGFPMLGAGYAIVLLCLINFAYRPALQR